jgi:HlyD family secretion protein
MDKLKLDTSQAIRRNMIAATFVIGMLAAAITLGASMPLDGAIIAPGTLIVEGSIKKIQHLTGGIVSEIAVDEGASVSAGDLLVRLDDTVTRANLDIIHNTLRAERARLARLQAQRDGLNDPVFPPDLAEDPGSRDIREGETRLARVLLTSLADRKRSFLQRIEQLSQEIKGLEEQQRSSAGQLAIVRKDIDDLEPLYKSGNLQRARISGLQRELLRNQGALGDAVARIAQSQARIIEAELQIIQNDHDFIAGVVQELRVTETKIAELQERKIAAEDQLRRLKIRTPLSGAVHQLAVHTLDGVISPGEVLMHIVPNTDWLVAEIRVRPSDVDQLSMGQEARIRFLAPDRGTTDELHGVLFRIAANVTQDTENGLAYYTAGVRLPKDAFERLNSRKPIPGMPVEAFLRTEARTLASYLVKPLSDQMERALRER